MQGSTLLLLSGRQVHLQGRLLAGIVESKDGGRKVLRLKTCGKMLGHAQLQKMEVGRLSLEFTLN